MIGTSRSFEPDQALLRPHTSSWQRDRASGPLLPMSRDLRRIRAALTNPDSRDKPLTVLCIWLAVIAAVVAALILRGAA